MKLSIILVNYNVKYFLEQALHSVVKACAKVPSSEIFVVDNNSVDGSVEMVKEKFPSVKLLQNKDNKGFSAANNQAIKISSGEYILLLNPDTIVEEDTFEKCVCFMDEHPDAGGLGVKMIDGAGNFLPESKRGLPSPGVAFWKISGLSALFPKSKIFGKYHLGYLDKDTVHIVDVLSGAFMMLRKSVLDRIGLLDEKFFMYGEDIDLSYRITLSGFKNYYFPGTRIIHYKGESTRKSSVNYVFVFYKAMVIFAEKHFSQQHARTFSFLIHFAIYLRAGIALAARFVQKAFLPFFDSLILFAGMFFLKTYWESNVKSAEGIHYYPVEYLVLIVPGYIAVWLLSVYFSGGYDKPVKPAKIIRGIFSGTVFILVIYALLPESMRFSRALILLGTVWAGISLVSSRIVFSLMGWKEFSVAGEKKKKIILVSDASEGKRVMALLNSSGIQSNIIGLVDPSGEPTDASAFKGSTLDLIGNIRQFPEIIEVYKPQEIIFCSKNISASDIIDLMSRIKSPGVEYKIAPPESMFIIGSSSVDNPGDLYIIDLNTISRPVNRRNKRLFDILLSLFLLCVSPLMIFIAKNPGRFFKNIFLVLAGSLTWVGYKGSSDKLPKLRKGILHPSDTLKMEIDSATAFRLNVQYAKDYRVYNDLAVILKAFGYLGREV